MITGAAVISEYQEYSNKKRVDFILNNYYGIEEYIRCYEEILCDSIVSDRLVDRREENGDPGVAIQTSHRSDPTAMLATDRTTVFEKMAENARTRHISDDLELNQDAVTLRTMKRDLGFVNHAIRMLPVHARSELGKVLSREKSLDDVADEKGIQYESAKMYVYRARLKVKKQALEFMDRACA